MNASNESNYRQRPWHLLRKTKGERLPSTIIVFSVWPQVASVMPTVQEHSFAGGYATAVRLAAGSPVDMAHNSFDRPEQLWDFIDSWRSRKATTWVFAHNLGYALCLLNFWDLLDRGGDEFVSAIISDPPTIVTTRRKGALIKYVDTQNYCRSDVPGPRSFDARAGGGERITPRCEHDHLRSAASRVDDYCTWLLGLIGCLGDTRAGSWSATAAGIAWNVYRHSFLGSPIWIHGNMDAIALERRALYGGRLEARKTGWVNEPTVAVDCNSLYPHVMASQRLPCKLIAHFQEGSQRVLYQALSRFFCVADVDLVCSHPRLPFKSRVGTRYTQGACRTVLAGAELIAARDSAAISKVHELAVYESADLFSGYVNYMYPRKMAAKAADKPEEAAFYKLCLNSLSGKFAQKGQDWHDSPQEIAADRYAVWWDKDVDTGRLRRLRSIAGHVQVNARGPEPRDTFPAILAGITAAGRVHLARAEGLAGQSAVLYCDTDSLHIDRVSLDRLVRAELISTDRLGAWKIAYEGRDSHYWGPKHYRIGEWWCCNYLSMTAHEVAHGTFLQDSYCGLSTLLASGQLNTVLVPQRTIQLGAGNWDRRTRLTCTGTNHHECRETSWQTQDTSSSLPLMQKNLLG